MEKRAWGERGDFRKVTVTLPPEVYDALVQESARRKSAGDPNHLLSAIAREWFAHRQPLLPIEKTELRIYAEADKQQPWYFLPTMNQLAQQLGGTDERVLVDLLVDLHAHGWLLLEKFSHKAGRYIPFASWPDASTFFYERGDVRAQVTIPGRRRKEALESKEHQDTSGAS
jgi:hypothetical protein